MALVPPHGGKGLVCSLLSGSELEKNHQVSTRVVEADLADPGAAERLAEAVADVLRDVRRQAGRRPLSSYRQFIGRAITDARRVRRERR